MCVLLHRFCGERMDVWVIRFAEHAPLKYHGLKEVAHCKTEEALAMVKSIWFLDSIGEQRQKAIGNVLERWPFLLQRHTAEISQQRMAAQYEQLVGPGNPSSGWQGMQSSPQHALKFVLAAWKEALPSPSSYYSCFNVSHVAWSSMC